MFSFCKRFNLRIPDVTPETVAVWLCLGLVGLLLLDEFSQWLALP